MCPLHFCALHLLHSIFFPCIFLRCNFLRCIFLRCISLCQVSRSVMFIWFWCSFYPFVCIFRVPINWPVQHPILKGTSSRHPSYFLKIPVWICEYVLFRNECRHFCTGPSKYQLCQQTKKHQQSMKNWFIWRRGCQFNPNRVTIPFMLLDNAWKLQCFWSNKCNNCHTTERTHVPQTSLFPDIGIIFVQWFNVHMLVFLEL